MKAMECHRTMKILVAIGLMICSPVIATGQTYPDKPIRMIVGFPPGGGADLVGRVIADQLGKKLNTPVIVINTPGAGSSIAASVAAKAAPDGYTILLATSSFTINPNIYKNVNYDPVKDFIPIAPVGNSPFYIVVRSSSPINSIKKLTTLARDRPGTLTYSSGGVGSVGNLAMELFKSRAQINILHIPYKGLAPAITALMGGTVDITMSDLATSLSAIRSGRLKAIAVTSNARAKWLPDVPTIAESGINEYQVVLWYGLFVPKGVPSEVLDKLYAAVVSIFKSPAKSLTDKYNALGDTLPSIESRETFAAFVKSDLHLWAKVVNDAKIRE